jgi:uncharacterized protein YoxC
MIEIILSIASGVVIIGALIYVLFVYMLNENKKHEKSINNLHGMIQRLGKKVDTLSGKVND